MGAGDRSPVRKIVPAQGQRAGRWEDSRSAAANRFSPHELLLACVADDLGVPAGSLNRYVRSLPKNGNANVRKALEKDLRRLRKYGPVMAIVDWDEIANLWKHARPRPPGCKQGIATRFREDAPGDYELVFLERNIETLVDFACKSLALGKAPKAHDERDAVLAKASTAEPSIRRTIRDDCPSFERIVIRVARHLRSTSG